MAENVNPIEPGGQPTIKRMIDRFRYANPMSREDRSFIDPNAKPDFWWTKLASQQAVNSSASLQPGQTLSFNNAGHTDGFSITMDPRNGFASFLPDTAPLQGSYRYNAQQQQLDGVVAPIGPDQELAALTARLFGRNAAPEPDYSGPVLQPPQRLSAEQATASAAEPQPSAVKPSKPLPASASIVAEDLDQALAGFRTRYRVDEASNVSRARARSNSDYDEDGNDEQNVEKQEGESGWGAPRRDSVSLSTSRRLFTGRESLNRSVSEVDGVDMAGMRASLSRAHALTAALRGDKPAVRQQASSRPPTGRNSANVTFDGGDVTAGDKVESRRRRLSDTLSSLAEGLDVSMLTLSRRLAQVSGDPGIMVEASASFMPASLKSVHAEQQAEAAELIREASKVAGGVVGQGGLASADGTLNASAASLHVTAFDQQAEYGVGRSSILALPMTGPSSPQPMSPRQRQSTTLEDMRRSWMAEVEASGGAEARVEEGVSATGPTSAGDPAGAASTSSASDLPPVQASPQSASISVVGAGAPASKQASMLDVFAAAMRGDVEGCLAALNGKPVPQPTASAADSATSSAVGSSSPRASRLRLTLEPEGRLSPETMMGLQKRRDSVRLNEAASAAAAVTAAASATSPPALPAAVYLEPVTSGLISSEAPATVPEAVVAQAVPPVASLPPVPAPLVPSPFPPSGLNTSMTQPGSSFVPLVSFIPPPVKPRAVLSSEGPMSLAGYGSGGVAALTSAEAQASAMALAASYSLPSPWGRPNGAGVEGFTDGSSTGAGSAAAKGAVVDMSALQAQALEAAMAFGPAVTPAMAPLSGVGTTYTPGRPPGGYTYQQPAQPSMGYGPDVGSAQGTVAIPAQLASAFAAFLQQHQQQQMVPPSPRSMPGYSGVPAIWPGGGPSVPGGQPGWPFMSQSAQIGSGRSGPPPGHAEVAVNWPTAGLPAALTMSTGLPSSNLLQRSASVGRSVPFSGGSQAPLSPSISHAVDALRKQPSPVAKELDRLMAAHDDIQRRATAALGLDAADLRRNQASRIATQERSSKLQSEVAEVRRAAAAAPTRYDDAVRPSAVTVEAQLTYRRAQDALAASARLRGMPTHGYGNGGAASVALGSGLLSSASSAHTSRRFSEQDAQLSPPGSGPQSVGAQDFAVGLDVGDEKEQGKDYVDLSGYRPGTGP